MAQLKYILNSGLVTWWLWTYISKSANDARMKTATIKNYQKLKTTFRKDNPKNEGDLKYVDNQKNKDYLKSVDNLRNEDCLINEDNLKNKDILKK